VNRRQNHLLGIRGGIPKRQLKISIHGGRQQTPYNLKEKQPKTDERQGDAKVVENQQRIIVTVWGAAPENFFKSIEKKRAAGELVDFGAG